MIKSEGYYKFEYFDLLLLIFDVEDDPEDSFVWIEDHKGNRGVLAAYDCGLGFSAWMPNSKNTNDGCELSAREITPVLKSYDSIPKNKLHDLRVASTVLKDTAVMMSYHLLRQGYDVFEWSKLKRADGKPLVIIEDK